MVQCCLEYFFLLENLYLRFINNESNSGQLLFGVVILSIGLGFIIITKFGNISINHLQFGENKIINWSDVRYVERVGFLILILTKTPRRIILFPVDKIGFIGWYYSDSSMIQLIEKAKEKHGL
jgi:ABC-type Mn2+/Zn2+ transport system permease subunit